MSAPATPLSDPALPALVIDLDGTLTPTDTLIESVLELAKHHPLQLLALPGWLLRGRAVLKAEVARRAAPDPTLLPWNEDLLAYIRQERSRGRRIVLATAAHRTIADAVAQHLQLFDDVIASDAGSNLKGERKLAAIRSLVGGDFVYAGDSTADLPIWRGAAGAILVEVAEPTAAAARAITPVEREFPRRKPQARQWLQLIRAHQWLKNVLLLVPVLTAFTLTDQRLFGTLVAAFLSFSLVASATYVFNDLWDLPNDRAHPRKRQRMLACGRIAIPPAVALSLAMLATGIGIGGWISRGFLWTLLVYLVTTVSYSWSLKRYVLIDAMALSLLYTLRIVAGAQALQMTVSSWLLAFSVFVFISLALVKRCTELISLDRAGKVAARGRDYRVTDLNVLWPLGVGAALSSVVVFGLFISSPESTAHYASPRLLWVVAIGLIYWLMRLWIKTSRSEMHDDPVVYALRDRGSRLTLAAMVAMVITARFLPPSFFT